MVVVVVVVVVVVIVVVVVVEEDKFQRIGRVSSSLCSLHHHPPNPLPYDTSLA